MSRPLLTAFTAALWLTACGGEPTESLDAGAPSRPDTGPPPALGDIEVSVEADVASFEGRFLVGAFQNEVPQMPPVALQRETDPSFPVQARLRGIEAGSYWVVGVIDYDPPSPTIPGVEDLTATYGPVEVLGDDVNQVALSFTLTGD